LKQPTALQRKLEDIVTLTEADVDIILHRWSVHMPLDDHSVFEDSKG
jgi:hypothetical protein